MSGSARIVHLLGMALGLMLVAYFSVGFALGVSHERSAHSPLFIRAAVLSTGEPVAVIGE